jgi:DNA (cytosine-5)-methyltransferase 1
MTLIKYIDLFAGIGGTRLGVIKSCFELGFVSECVFTSEWDKFAQKTYEANFGEKPEGDITKIRSADIPEHNLLLAGFPCQPFSIAGISKKNALKHPHGFSCDKQGNLFFVIERIIRDKQPEAFLLENVKHLGFQQSIL